MNGLERVQLDATIDGLGRIVQASSVTQKRKGHIEPFPQARTDAEEDAELGTGTRNVYAVMDTIENTEEHAAVSLAAARKGESEVLRDPC